MAEGSNSQDELIGDIYQGTIEPILEDRARTSFKPWHKPRKHFIRIKQWCHHTRKLLKVLKIPDEGELRYLGLPGEDLIDIRMLKGVCKPQNVMLRYLGFDTSIGTAQLNLSKHEVNSDPFIHPSSIVVGDRLQELASTDTMAYRYVERHAPFDVINLDLCDSITTSAGEGIVPYMEAIRTLCDVQISRRGDRPWLMFLTTRAIRADLDSATCKRLFQQLLLNIQQNDGFATALNGKLGLNDISLKGEQGGTSALNASEWLNAYVLSLAKWLLHYMMAHEYKIAVRMLDGYVYAVHANRPDMLALAFHFEPAVSAREDLSGVTKPRAAPTVAPTEFDLASDFLDRIVALENVDKKLNENRDLLLSMFTKSASLLGSLRYDQAAYRRFALGE